MATDKSVEALVVLESFIGRIGDEDRFFRAGELIRTSDPAVKKWPAMFGPAIYRHDEVKIESATAAPGEKRGA
jgi:hypothetical protein